MRRIWERYLFAAQARLTLFILAGLYLLFIVIDYSTHARHFSVGGASWLDIGLYYFYQFSLRWELLAPFALMLATMRVLCQLNANNELVALFSSGVTRKRIMRPLIYGALLVMLSVWANFEWIRPKAVQDFQQLEVETMRPGMLAGPPKGHLRGFTHEDGSTVIYQSFDNQRGAFFDLYWLLSGDEVYRVKYLYPGDARSTGRQVDHLKRDEEGSFQLVAQYETLELPELVFNEATLHRSLHSPKTWSLSTLWRQFPDSEREAESDRGTQIIASFHHKLALPWLCLLVALAPAPWCLHFSRRLPFFLLFGIAVVGFVLFLMLNNAALVLGEAQFLSPHMAPWLPVFGLGGLFLLPYSKMQ